MAIYYIDPIGGSDNADGSSPERAIKNYRAVTPVGGDSILFRRGSFMRDTLDAFEGEAGAPITYGAWGEGDAPIFCGSTDISAPEKWVDEGGGVWRCTEYFGGEVGNLIFDGGVCNATLRWSREELTSQGDFYDSGFGCRDKRCNVSETYLYLFSEKPPYEVYSQIEAAHAAKFRISRLKNYTVIEDLEFKNNGIHALQGTAHDVTVRRCKFSCIGGCIWSVELRIRYGNCLEFWNIGDNVTVEDCVFEKVYDSCITHQGGDAVQPAHNFICRRNKFDTYGMAAFEYRDRLPINSCFTDNVCKNAGCGFAMLGETLPRRSEIWPEPMGHHVFLWRIEKASEGGSLEIARNEFGAAPVGAAIYSIISADAEAQMTVRDNVYRDENTILSVFFGSRVYADGAEWEKKQAN